MTGLDETTSVVPAEILLEAIWDNSPHLLMLLDNQACIVRFSPAAESLTGYTEQEVRGHDMWEFLVRSPDAQAARGRFNHLLVSGGTSAGETCVVNKLGRELCVTWKATRVGVDSSAQVLVSACDITQPRQAEHELHDTTRQYRELVENVNSIIMKTDLEGRVTFLNSFAERFFGYTEAEVLGHLAVGLLLPEIEQSGRDLRSMLQWLRTHLDCRHNGDTEVLLRDGTRAWVHWTMQVTRDQAGDPAGLLVVGSDIGAYKHTAAKLQASERRFRELADMLPDMVYEAAVDGRIIYANDKAFETLGYTRGDLQRGMNVLELLAPEEREVVSEALRRIAGGESDRQRRHVRCADGTLLPVEIHSTAIRNADGSFAGYRGVIRDIRDQQEMEEAQRLAALGQLAAGVAHEFNNILAAMFGWAELARTETEQQSQARLVDAVLLGSARGAEICKKLIRYARPLEPARKPLQVEEPLCAALSIAEKELEQAEIEVVCDFDTADRCLLGDPGQLQQVFLNLIINARQAMRGGGRLTLTTRFASGRDSRGEIIAQVSDTGSGIRAEDLPRVFEPFFTTKAMDCSEFSGSGLGLSVSQSIVMAHGGSITVTSAEGVGTTFTLRFATEAAAPPLTLVEPSTPVEAVAQCEPRRLLLAEDEKNILEVLRQALSQQGHEVHAVPTTAEALNALQDETYDLVITDLLMPGGGGSELLNASRRLDKPPPILLITGMVEDRRLEQMMKQGVKACLRKPFSLIELMQTVDELLSA